MATAVNDICHEAGVSTDDPGAIRVVMANVFNDEAVRNMPKASREKLELLCETIQGFCYMMVLDQGALKGWMVFRSLQFTAYMDRALEQMGFLPQAKQQKERILEAMNMKIDGWAEITGD